MEFSKLATWIGLTGLAAAMAGCPAGDDTATTDPVAETGMTIVATPATSTGTSTGATPAESSSGGMAESSTGEATCDPPCEDGEMCVSGTCIDVGGSSTGEPPPECSLPAALMFDNVECGTCLEANCCAQLMTCFGDETTNMETPCGALNNCIVANCAMAMDLQACVDMNCADNAAELPNFIAINQCAGMNCLAECT